MEQASMLMLLVQSVIQGPTVQTTIRFKYKLLYVTYKALFLKTFSFVSYSLLSSSPLPCPYFACSGYSLHFLSTLGILSAIGLHPVNLSVIEQTSLPPHQANSYICQFLGQFLLALGLFLMPKFSCLFVCHQSNLSSPITLTQLTI